MLPVLFIGHGSPMNAIQNNPFTQTLARLGKEIPTPKAVVCISAHWLTEGTWATHMQSPRTIHDFYGFPEPLFDVQYPSPGAPLIAEHIRDAIKSYEVQMDDEIWGIDHGTWSVLRHMYPQANIPVIQLSINHSRPFQFHYELGQQLQKLRDENILIVGSGNIVHNLRQISWEQNAEPYDWAIEFDEWIKTKILQKDFQPLMTDVHKTQAGKLSVPTTDHYIPILYTVGASTPSDTLTFEYEGIENSSISMRCVKFG